MPYQNINVNTVTLKDGRTVDIKHGTFVWVKGNVEFSRIVTKYTAQEIEDNNKKRQEWRAKNNKKPAPNEDPNKPYTTMTIQNVQIVPASKDGQLSNEECLVMDKFYTSEANPGVVHAAFKNITQNTPDVYLKQADGQMSNTPTKIPGELAAGVPVLLGLRVYCTPRLPGISLSRVYCIGDVQYRQNKTETQAAEALAAIGLKVGSDAAPQSYVETHASYEAEPDEAVFDDTGVVAAATIPQSQPQYQQIQQPAPQAAPAPAPQAAPAPQYQQQQVTPPISQAQQLLKNYQPVQGNPAAGQGYGTGVYNQ